MHILKFIIIIKIKMEQLFKDADTDGNGEIDLNEFKALLVKLGTSVSDEEAQAEFEKVDGNGNGLIETG
jgi:Ca2+-binding EF-hand superfamily protein